MNEKAVRVVAGSSFAVVERRVILWLERSGPASATEIVARLIDLYGNTRANVYLALRKLKRKGVIKLNSDGYYGLVEDPSLWTDEPRKKPRRKTDGA